SHGRDRGLVGHAGAVFISEKFYITTKWNSRYLPSRAVAVIETHKLRAESNGKSQNPNATPARNEEMPKLVEKHHDAQYEQEWQAAVATQDPPGDLHYI